MCINIFLYTKIDSLNTEVQMGIAETRIYPINTGWLEADLGTYIFWKRPVGKKYWNPV